VGTGMCRFIRPVQHRETGLVEYLGPMEQPFLEIACMPEDIREEVGQSEERRLERRDSSIPSTTITNYPSHARFARRTPRRRPLT